MAVARATFAKSVTYTVRETPDPSSSAFEMRPRLRHRGSTSPTAATTLREARKGRTSTAVAEDVRTECAGCRIEMRVEPSSVRGLHYLVCPKCGARFASNYEEVFAAGGGVKRTRADGETERGETDKWKRLRERAEAFHRKVDESDPFRVLGLDPRTPFAEVRAHYYELASVHHPDHGGDPESMRRLIDAYERIRAIAAQRAAMQIRSKKP